MMSLWFHLTQGQLLLLPAAEMPMHVALCCGYEFAGFDAYNRSLACYCFQAVLFT